MSHWADERQEGKAIVMGDEKLYNIDVRVLFQLTDKDEFWQALVDAAARIDDQQNGESQASYSQGQAFTVVFHYDGFTTIERLMLEVGDRAGWSVEGPSWEGLAEVGVTYDVTVSNG